MRPFLSAWPLLLPLLLLLLSCLTVARAMSDSRRLALRDETADLFRHGYEGYMKYAYPADELRPLSCGPLSRDRNPANIGINDIHANVSITLIDVLSSLPVLHPSAYPRAIELVASQITFDQDVKIQVFEMTIRALGGLLSTYQYLDELPDDPAEQATALGLNAERDSWNWGKKVSSISIDIKRHKSRILELALDLGKRLLPAFNTLTGIPYARVNLRRGVEKGESIETCTAGAGSLLLEFALLSRLTGDDRFENLAHRAYMALWNRRSQHNLLGNTIGATHGHWLAPGLSGVGAGMDSFFEYGLKAGIMLNDDTYSDIFYDSYAAIQTHVRTLDGFIVRSFCSFCMLSCEGILTLKQYRPIQSRTLLPASPSTIDSLSAFLAGTQVLAGDLDSAIRSHLVYWNLWRKYSAIPESWAWAERKIEWAGWPGRPEFIESTYYLYQATRDPFYLRVGERVLQDLRRRTRTSCGFATIKNVETGELEDRMESFVLSETLKYLYLLFSDTPFANTNKVFTTEGHPLRIPRDLLRAPSSTRRSMRRGESQYCPAYEPYKLGGGGGGPNGLVVGIESRPEYEYARALVFGWDSEGIDIEREGARRLWRYDGVCALPLIPKYAFEIVLSPLNTTNITLLPPEDPSPGLNKVQQDPHTGDFTISDIEGLRLGVRWRLDGKGYDVANIGPHRVRSGQQVVIHDPAMHDYLPVLARSAGEGEDERDNQNQNQSPPEVLIRFTAYPASTAAKHFRAQSDDANANSDTGSNEGSGQTVLHAVGATATFGRDFGISQEKENETGKEKGRDEGWSLSGPGLRLVILPPGELDGCGPIDPDSVARSASAAGAEGEGDERGFLLMLQRGGCTFLDKLINAQQVGASGVLVVGHPPEDEYELENENDDSEGGGGWDDVGLIRPSADIPPVTRTDSGTGGGGEGDKAGGGGGGRGRELSGVGMVYTEYLVGEILKRIVEVEQKVVGVELLPLEHDDGSASSGAGAGAGAAPYLPASGKASEQSVPREGKLMVGQWEICNLRVVEKPP